MTHQTRCAWCGTDPLYVAYHDTEWGNPVHNDQKHFEFLVLETFQAGLSWITILRKRENFRKAFAAFDPTKVAQFTDADVERLMADAGIVRNRAKIVAAIGNAKAFLNIQSEKGSFDSYIWGFVDHKPLQNNVKTMADIPSTTALATLISKDLKKRGFAFVGPTVVYANMQAIGMVNDHITTCFRHAELA